MDRFASVRRHRAFDLSRSALLIVFGATATVLPLATFAQSADTYRNRPVKVLVPYAPGGSTDIFARHLATKLQEALGQPFVVDNRAGASAYIAREAWAR